MATINISALLSKLTQDYGKARATRKKRRKAGLSKLAEAMGLFGPDYMGDMEKTTLTGATSAFGTRRGMGGSARPTATSPTMKAGFEDVRRTGLANALTTMADYRKTFPDIYPAPGTLSYLATGGFGLGLEKEQLALQKAAVQMPGQPLGANIGSPEWNRWVRSGSQVSISGR